jgi:glycosyltransferase involved in cell wall biosynthesis
MEKNLRRWPVIRLTLFLLVFFVSALEGKRFSTPLEFVIVSPSYNNENYCQASLQSVACQTYPHWSLVYIDDRSKDNTRKLVESFIISRGLSHKCTLISNKKRVGALANLYKVINKLPKDVIVVNLDGDDRFAHPEVLRKLAQVYADSNVWMTYGNYQEEPAGITSVCAPFPQEVIDAASFRMYPFWISSHLKTYYAKLFQKIKKKDFRARGKFLQQASDLAFMFPMLEMASKGHIRFIPDVLYVYNRSNPLNDEKNYFKKVRRLDKKIRGKKRYKSLNSLF